MTLHGAGKIPRSQIEFDGEHALTDQVRGSRPKNVDTQDPVRLGMGDDLHQPLGLSHTACARGAREGIGTDIMLRARACSSVSPTLATSGKV